MKRWILAAGIWVIVAFAALQLIVVPAFSDHDLRLLISLIGGAFLGYVAATMLVLGWYSR